jgi:hypothetical protein
VSAERWSRLVTSLADAGVAARVDTRAFPGGVSRSISVRRSAGLVIEINDTWWRKNQAVWIGWVVTVSGRDDFVKAQWRNLKDRRAACDAVLEALRMKVGELA